MPACGAAWDGAPPCFRGCAPGASRRGWGQRLFPRRLYLQLSGPLMRLFSPARRCREVESALNPRRETFLLLGGSDTILLITVMTRCILLGVVGVTQVLKSQVPFACLARGSRQLEPQYYQRKWLVALEFQHFILGELCNRILATLLCVR